MSEKYPPTLTMPEGRDNQCQGRKKTCSECGHRFTKAEHDRWNCPECGANRRCSNNKYKGMNTCRVHGSAGGRPDLMVKRKFKMARQKEAEWVRAMNSPELFELASEMALVQVRIDLLMRRMESMDPRTNHDMIQMSIEEIESGLEAMNMRQTARGLSALRAAIEPMRVEDALWGQIFEAIDLSRKVSESERKFMLANRKDMPIQIVLELMQFMQRVMFRYIPTQQDRIACADEIRQLIEPSIPSITMG